MNLKFADYILAIDEARSITHAAKRIGVSQGTLSNFLLKHEREMGMQIFVRYKKSLIPTPMGKIYRDTLRQMVSIKQYAYQSIRTQCCEVYETIRIGVSPSRGLKNLTEVYSEFVKCYPDVKLEITEEYVSRLKEMLSAGEIDMFFGALTDEEIENPQLEIYKMRKQRIVAAAHKFLVKDIACAPSDERFMSINCEQLSEFPLIIHGERTGIRHVIDKLFTMEHFQPTVIAEGNNTRMVKALIQRGLGIGFIPEDYLDEPEMSSVSAFYVKPEIHICICIAIPSGHTITPAEQALAELMWKNETNRLANSP